MTTATKQKVTAKFEYQKDTPNTRKFIELPEPGVAPAIKTLYVQKHVLQGLGDPERLTVTIEA